MKILLQDSELTSRYFQFCNRMHGVGIYKANYSVFPTNKQRMVYFCVIYGFLLTTRQTKRREAEQIRELLNIQIHDVVGIS
jgi:hypothetical protein